MLRLLGLLALLTLAACDRRPEVVPRYFSPTDNGTPVLIPLEPGVDDSAELVGRVCRPEITGRRPVVVINHGSPPRSDLRQFMQPTGCDSEPAQWFTDRGFVVIFALRRGFGGSTGPVVEDNGPCRMPNYFRSGLFGAMDIDAILRFAGTLPYVDARAAVVVGQSTGGWATIAYDSSEVPKSVTFINFAGGRGGHAYPEAPTNCRPDMLVDAIKRLGQRSIWPMLWIYAENDTFFPPPLVKQMHTTYTAAGGRAELVFTPPFGAEGHDLFYGRGGSDVWGPIVETYLAQSVQ